MDDRGSAETGGHRADPRQGIFGRSLLACGVALVAAMLGVGTLAIVEARNDAWHQAEQSSHNLLMALQSDIARNIGMLDLSIRGVAETLAEPGIDAAAPGVRHRALFDRSTTEGIGAILVLDAKGDVVEDSTSLVPHRLNLADREQFAVQRERPDVGLYISRTYRSRLVEGDLRIAISRRLPDADGAFAGVVEGALRLSYFRKLFDKMDLNSAGVVALVRSDGRIIVRSPFRAADVDRDLSAGPSFQHMAATGSGQYVGRAAVDGVERLYAYGRIGDLPLILSVGVAVDDIFAAWRERALIMGAVLALLCAATLALCLLFGREIRIRLAAERDLKATAAELAVMAAVDGLTGLPNRRTCDTELQREWQRSIRNSGSMSVLMIDVDCFKSFNDRYGHQEGDRVLRAVAAAIDGCARRPADIVARYGGEEFLVLLPDTDAAGAAVMAERVRLAVARLAMPHEGAPSGCVTVSIGGATLPPRPGDVPSRLVEAADLALYAAKRDGRNRVVMAPETYRRATTTMERDGQVRRVA